MGHHHHNHHHHHHGSTENIRTAFLLNLVFTLIEVVGGILTNSISVLSDALHDFGDTLSLGLSWYFDRLSKKKGDDRFTYGYGRFSLLAALINAIVLITGSVIILTEAIPRIWQPPEPNASGMLVLSVLGVLFNGAAMLKLQKGKSMNERMVYLHMLEDVLGWVALLIISIVMYFYHLPILDPIFSVVFTAYILWNVLKNLRKVISIFLQSRPEGISVNSIQQHLAQVNHVCDVHDVHVWSMDGEQTIATMHIVVPQTLTHREVAQVKLLSKEALGQMGIQHSTIEIECDDEQCPMCNLEHNHQHQHE